MSTLAEHLKNHFPLNNLAAPLETFQPPSGAFDPEGEWVATYGVCTLTAVCNRVGELRLRRGPAEMGFFDLEVQYIKSAPGGFSQRVQGKLCCRNDALATPVEWTYHFATHNADGDPLPGTDFEKKGRFAKDAMIVSDKTGSRAYPCPEPRAGGWALFDAVQRAPREAFGPIRFTLIEHFDQVKPNQSLSFRESFILPMGGKRVQRHTWRELDRGRIRATHWDREGDHDVRLHVYGQTGDGIVPWVYWKDDANRLLFAVSGLEAYILEPEGEKSS